MLTRYILNIGDPGRDPSPSRAAVIPGGGDEALLGGVRCDAATDL